MRLLDNTWKRFSFYLRLLFCLLIIKAIVETFNLLFFKWACFLRDFWDWKKPHLMINIAFVPFVPFVVVLVCSTEELFSKLKFTLRDNLPINHVLRIVAFIQKNCKINYYFVLFLQENINFIVWFDERLLCFYVKSLNSQLPKYFLFHFPMETFFKRMENQKR